MIRDLDTRVASRLLTIVITVVAIAHYEDSIHINDRHSKLCFYRKFHMCIPNTVTKQVVTCYFMTSDGRIVEMNLSKLE